MIWTKDKPILDKAWYWWRPPGCTNEEAMCVLVRLESSSFQMAQGEWSHRPISFPDEAVKADYSWDVRRDGPLATLSEEEAKKVRPAIYITHEMTDEERREKIREAIEQVGSPELKKVVERQRAEKALRTVAEKEIAKSVAEAQEQLRNTPCDPNLTFGKKCDKCGAYYGTVQMFDELGEIVNLCSQCTSKTTAFIPRTQVEIKNSQKGLHVDPSLEETSRLLEKAFAEVESHNVPCKVYYAEEALKCTLQDPYTEQRVKDNPGRLWIHSDVREISSTDLSRWMRCNICGCQWKEDFEV
jgi:hypothetical protein